MKGKTILLVDDDEAHLLWATEILGDEGLDITVTSSGTEALAMLERTSYDLIISDLNMPEMSGTELVEKVADIYVNQKVIIMTGHGDVESFMQSVYGLGALEYIIKPVEAEDFISMVRKLISLDTDIASTA